MDQNNPDYSFDVANFVLLQFKGIIGNSTWVAKAYPMDNKDFVNINYDNPISNIKGTEFVPMTAYLHWQQIYYDKKKKELENAIN
jgi:hypothetical protein